MERLTERKIRKCISKLENLVINDNNNKYIIVWKLEEVRPDDDIIWSLSL